MPLWHSSPLSNWMMSTMFAGGTVVLLHEYHPQQFLQTVQDERITLYFGAPVSCLAPLHYKLDPGAYDLGSVRAWIYGGGPISAGIAARLATVYQSDRFFQVYGMTETGPVGTTLYPEEQLTKAGSIGRVALPGVDMRVVLEDGIDASAGEVGEIWLKADSVMQGYLDDPEATAQGVRRRLVPHRRSRPAGCRRLSVHRRSQQGHDHHRRRERLLEGGRRRPVDDPAVQDAAVIGRPHPEWGEAVIAIVVPRAEQKVEPEALREFLSTRLAPREFHVRETLPRTPTGKVMKHMLREDV